jgi:hypothetical protein
VLLVGAFVVGWSVGRSATEAAPRTPEAWSAPAVPIAEERELVPRPLPRRRPSRRALLVLAGAAVAARGAAGALTRPDAARAPLIAPAVAAHEHALAVKAADAARLSRLRHLQLSGIAGRRVAMPARAKPKAPPLPRVVVRPSDRAVALATYIDALGTDTILRGLDASKSQLEQQVLNDPRVSIYPGGRGDVSSGRVDVRVLAMIEYLAQANGQVSVTCLISGHSLFVHGRPGVVSAHIYGRAVDIGGVAGVSILDHQGAGSITERAIRQILALPASIEPLQVISLMTLGGPSFALPDHYNHIHIGY